MSTATGVEGMRHNLSQPDIDTSALLPYTTNWFHHAHIQARARRAGWGLYQAPLSRWGGGS